MGVYARRGWLTAILLALFLVTCSHRSLPPPASEPLTLRNGDVTLAATLFRPSTRGPHPAVIVFHGSGEPLRSSRAYEHLVAALPAAGYAVLLFDRRGSGESTGDFNTATFEDLARDGLAGIEELKRRPGIDRRRIGVWGVSQGGWLAPLASTLSSDVAFVVSVSGPGVSPARQMDFAAREALRAVGAPAEVIGHALDVRAIVDDYYRGRVSRASAEREVAAIRDEPWFGSVYLPRGGNLPDDPKTTKWYREMDFDPVAVVSRVAVPTAFFFAESDPWVPVEQSMFAVAAATRSNTDVTIHRVPGTTHYMHGGPGDLDGEISPTYLRLLLTWLRGARPRT